ncbi:MAG: methionine adenosyltransferase, partial [Oceanipulchritudo sp.]
KLCRRLAQVRKDKTVPYLRPDGKSQVTIEYSHGIPKRVVCVVLGAHHDPGVKRKIMEHDLIEQAIKKVVPANLLDNETEYYINSALTAPALSRLFHRTFGPAQPAGTSTASPSFPGYAP